jgi:hypothetical protein
MFRTTCAKPSSCSQASWSLELCSNAGPALEEAAELRVWTSADRVRVELRAASEILLRAPEGDGPQYDHILLDQIADRWSIAVGQDLACVWFEIGRKPSAAAIASQTKREG